MSAATRSAPLRSSEGTLSARRTIPCFSAPETTLDRLPGRSRPVRRNPTPMIDFLISNASAFDLSRDRDLKTRILAECGGRSLGIGQDQGKISGGPGVRSVGVSFFRRTSRLSNALGSTLVTKDTGPMCHPNSANDCKTSNSPTRSKRCLGCAQAP